MNATNVTNAINPNANSEQKKLKIHCDIKDKLDYFIKQKKNSQYYIPRVIRMRKKRSCNRFY